MFDSQPSVQEEIEMLKARLAELRPKDYHKPGYYAEYYLKNKAKKNAAAKARYREKLMIQHDLSAALRRADAHTNNNFNRMQHEQKVKVRDLYVRHLIACQKSGVEPEPLFLAEVVSEVKAGR